MPTIETLRGLKLAMALLAPVVGVVFCHWRAVGARSRRPDR